MLHADGALHSLPSAAVAALTAWLLQCDIIWCGVSARTKSMRLNVLTGCLISL